MEMEAPFDGLLTDLNSCLWSSIMFLYSYQTQGFFSLVQHCKEAECQNEETAARMGVHYAALLSGYWKLLRN